VLADIRVVLLAARPESYDTPGPIEVSVYEGFPGAVKDKWGLPTLMLSDVREFFEWTETHGRALLDRFETLRNQAHRRFDELPDEGGAAFAETMRLVVEESPIRIFKEEIGKETYKRIIGQHLSRK
jgi:hypothetical protein